MDGCWEMFQEVSKLLGSMGYKPTYKKSVYWGYNPLILTFYKLPATSKWKTSFLLKPGQFSGTNCQFLWDLIMVPPNSPFHKGILDPQQRKPFRDGWINFGKGPSKHFWTSNIIWWKTKGTPPKTNMEPENDVFQKRISSSRASLHVPC